VYDTLGMDGQKCTYATEPPLGSQDVNGFKAFKCRRRLDTPPYPLHSRQTLARSAAGERATHRAIIHGGLLRILQQTTPPLPAVTLRYQHLMRCWWVKNSRGEEGKVIPIIWIAMSCTC